MLRGFFGGLSLTGYVMIGLGSLLIGSWIVMGFMARNITGLHEDLGAANTSIEVITNANIDNIKSMRTTEALLKECVDKRAAAEQRGTKAIQELALQELERGREQDEREDAINEAIALDPNTPSIDGIVVPPRATELLIESACRANRGEDC